MVLLARGDVLCGWGGMVAAPGPRLPYLTPQKGRILRRELPASLHMHMTSRAASGIALVAVLSAAATWPWLRPLSPLDERARSEAEVAKEVANGWEVNVSATPEGLSAAERRRYAIAPDATYRTVALGGAGWQGIVAGGEAWAVGGGAPEVRSAWAVWATGALLSRSECAGWVRRAEGLDLETGDFIFAGSATWGDNSPPARMATGARRQRSSRAVERIVGVGVVFHSICSPQAQRNAAGGGRRLRRADARAARRPGSNPRLTEIDRD